MSNRLKLNIESKLNAYTYDCVEDKLILGTIVYSICKNQNPNTVLNYVEGLTATKRADIIALKTGYVSYDTMVKYISSLKKTTFNSLLDKEIDVIYTYYVNKRSRENFDINTFSQYAYNVFQLSLNQLNKLRETHFNILVPIIKYYITYYGRNEYDMQIVSAIESMNQPGKIITFNIKGIPPEHVALVLDNKFSNDSYTYSVTSKGIRIVVK